MLRTLRRGCTFISGALGLAYGVIGLMAGQPDTPAMWGLVLICLGAAAAAVLDGAVWLTEAWGSMKDIARAQENFR